MNEALCRSCLIQSADVFHLNSIIEDNISENKITISNALEKVTSTKINLDPNLPDCICSICLDTLKQCLNFVVQFESHQKILYDNFNLLKEAVQKQDAILKDEVLSENEELMNDYRVEQGLADHNDVEEELILIKVKDEKSDYECSWCSETFSSFSNLQNHVRLLHCEKVKLYACDKCGHVSRSRSGFQHHRKTHEEKQFVCEVCSKSFHVKGAFMRHMQGHKNERKFLCTICGKAFNYSNALQYHLRVHTDERKYNCNYCSAKFKMSCSLKRHLSIHTGEKPYECPECKKSFASKGELSNHSLVHSGIKPYTCKHCKKGFTKSHNLKMHLLVHKGPHKCLLCHKSFIEESILEFHNKVRHNN